LQATRIHLALYRNTKSKIFRIKIKIQSVKTILQKTVIGSPNSKVIENWYDTGHSLKSSI
jgi:hypothetical protein